MNVSTTRIVYALCAIAFVVIVARAYMNVKGADALVPQLPQAQVQAFAREQLNALQQPSFDDNLELCGIIFETSEGELGVSRPQEGNQESCDLRYFDEPGMVPIANFHTHGSYSPRYDGEVPSLIDIQGNVASRLDGYITTPGGRFWHIDHEDGTARLVCGPGCVAQDPRYIPCPGDPVAQSYTPQELAGRFSTARAPC